MLQALSVQGSHANKIPATRARRREKENFVIEYFDVVLFMRQKQRRKKRKDRAKNKEAKESKKERQEGKEKRTRRRERQRKKH